MIWEVRRDAVVEGGRELMSGAMFCREGTLFSAAASSKL